MQAAAAGCVMVPRLAPPGQITDPPERDEEGRAYFLLKKPVSCCLPESAYLYCLLLLKKPISCRQQAPSGGDRIAPARLDSTACSCGRRRNESIAVQCAGVKNAQWSPHCSQPQHSV